MTILSYKNKTIFLAVFLIIATKLVAQSSAPLLERRITVTITNQPLDKALTQISEQAGCVFSYSSQAINIQNIVSVKAVNKPLKVVLKSVLGDQISYKVSGKYIILKKADKAPAKPDKVVLEGYVYDHKTGHLVTEASIYDKQLMVSAITDKYGYFRIEIPKDKQLGDLFVSKAGYTDTLVLAATNDVTQQMMEISLNASKQTVKKNTALSSWLVPEKLKIHAANLTDSLFRKVQFSLFPMVNTNALLTGNTKNEVSFNMTVGYVYAIEKCEFGAGINIVRTNAGVCQLAGAGNIVGGNSSGLQAAGGFNMARSSSGIQCAGGLNVVKEKAPVQFAGGLNIAKKSGVQASGGLNIASEAHIQLTAGMNLVRDSSDLQISGGVNMARESAVQLSSGINIATKSAKIQTSAGANIAGNSDLQITAGLNTAKNSKVQLSAAMNYATRSKMQIACLNIAHQVSTLQLGIVNIADSCDGIPLGLFSYVKSGYHCFEASIDESSVASLAYRSGVRRFHTFFEAGIATKKTNNRFFAYGYGLGTSIGNERKTLFDIDLSVRQFATTKHFILNTYQFRFYAGFDRRVFKHLSLAAGLSWNILTTTDHPANQHPDCSSIAPYSLGNSYLGNSVYQTNWLGVKVALRFW